MKLKKEITLLLCLLMSMASQGQNAEIRGFVYDQSSGQALSFATVLITGVSVGTLSDNDGFYTLIGLEPGKYEVYAISLGYDTVYHKIELTKNQKINLNINLNPIQSMLKEARIDRQRIRRTTTTKISEINITPKQLTQIPTVGGEPDLVQYLQVLPGVVFSGDQGGQLYIRGGSPIMNKVLLDGMTIYNPFHSIGLFSVFDADIIKSVDVYSAGFSAEYGGRISAIVDVQTRDGNRNELSGKANVNPFTSKILLDGPLKKYKEGGASSSFIVSYKNSYLDKTSPILYDYVAEDKLPYSFSDLYTKLSFNSASGSYLKLFYFDYNDKVDFEGTTSYNWNSSGFGGKFLMVPQESKSVIDGFFAYSNYGIDQIEINSKPRSSGINGFNMGLNFTYFLKNSSKLKYGMEVNGFKTLFKIFNAVNREIDQDENTTELAGFVNYNLVRGKFIVEPGFRMQAYASLGNTSYEPRLRFKYLINRRLRFKMASGIYSQNLISASSDRDVVNLFYGFLSGPEELPKTVGKQAVTHRMQTARHAVGGFEFDLNSNSNINVETYIKDFTQISNINRDKIYDDNLRYADKPESLRKDFIVETGTAYGYDITYMLQTKQLYLWLVYSYNNVSRYDGIRNYQPHFDRRHNANVVSSYAFGKDQQYEANLRWNFGSGFPFTLTQGFYENLSFGQGSSVDYTTANGDFTVAYDDINRGRLPYYHRLDISVKRTIVFTKKDSKPKKFMEIIASATNVYNRENIFYFDRVSFSRVNQLPFLPSLSISYSF
jgi:CarboxypepD_reg-like domain/TonB-dependent Receptor Plug Domain